ncbi:terminase large subunit domain-containing protein [Mycolicibacterium septicum]|nr:terminase large subunit [Mycolicibacterium septicum]
MIGRGNGKSSLLAALAVYELFTGADGGSIVVCARNQDQAQIIFTLARTLVETSPELLARCQVGRERLYVPRNRSDFRCLVSEPESLEGLNYSLCLVDELGVTPRETVEVLMLALGKRPVSTLVGIGTPGPDPTDSVLTDWRNMHHELGDDFIVWREFSAEGYQSHPVDCEHCARLANPAYGDFLDPDSFRILVKTTRENSFRRSRLCQFVNDTMGEFLPLGLWDSLSTDSPVPDGSEVVLALDGSFNNDSTGLLVASVETVPHVDVVALWENPGDKSWRSPVLEVEDAIREACKRWNVRELVADPFRFTRTLQVLAAEGIPVMEFPHSPSRLTAATTDLYKACTNAGLTHSGDARLAAHVSNAVVVQDSRGMRLDKASRSVHAHKIDLAACLVMGYSRASWLASHPKKHYRAGSW